MTSAWNYEFYGGLSKVEGGQAEISQTQQCNDDEGDKCYAWRDRRDEFWMRQSERRERRKGRQMTRLDCVLFNTQKMSARDESAQSKVHEWLESSRQCEDGIE
jgi:hypothetical protein